MVDSDGNNYTVRYFEVVRTDTDECENGWFDQNNNNNNRTAMCRVTHLAQSSLLVALYFGFPIG